jgi:hypothetical protein
MTIPTEVMKDLVRKGTSKNVGHKARSKKSAKFKADVTKGVNQKQTQGTKKISMA